MKTKFALTPLRIGAYEFWFDGNGKITVGNGTFEQPTANAFSLVQVDDCPGATTVCKENCYVNHLEKAQPLIHAAYHRNSREIRRALDARPTDEIAKAFARWIREHAPHGFRWHVSGDLFSMKYAYFVGLVCDNAPDVPFWIYTRSFRYLSPILGLPNLAVNLSADADNYATAYAVWRSQRSHGCSLRICYMTVDGALPDDLPAGSVIFPSHQLRGRDLPKPTDAPWWQGLTHDQKKMVCPPDFFGQSEKLRCGPCKKCLEK